MLKTLLFLLILILADASLRAQPVPSVSPPVATPADAIAADAAEYGRMFDVPITEALRRLQAQEASVAMVDQLAEACRDRLAGVVIEHRPDYRIVIVVTGPPAPDVLLATAPFDVPIVLRSGGVATRAATLDAIEQHQAEIRAALRSPPGMGVDPRTGGLVVMIRTGDWEDDPDGGTLAERLAAIAGVPVAVTTWRDLDLDLAVEGGGRVAGRDAASARSFVCTAGFIVTDGTQTALSTAAHCPDELSFVDRDGSRTPPTMIGAWGALYQDVQIHTAPVPLLPAFHGDSESRTRPVTTWRNRLSTRAGDVVCHRGQRTGYSCALVQFVDYAPPGDLCAGPCPATWVAVAGPTCRGGDSGGPVFLGTVAFGLLKGDSQSDGICRLYYYMSVDHLPPGWTVLHTGSPLADPALTAKGAPRPE